MCRSGRLSVVVDRGHVNSIGRYDFPKSNSRDLSNMLLSLMIIVAEVPDSTRKLEYPRYSSQAPEHSTLFGECKSIRGMQIPSWEAAGANRAKTHSPSGPERMYSTEGSG